MHTSVAVFEDTLLCFGWNWVAVNYTERQLMFWCLCDTPIHGFTIHMQLFVVINRQNDTFDNLVAT